MKFNKVLIACDLSETDKVLFHYVECLRQRVPIGSVMLVHVLKNMEGFHDLMSEEYERKVADFLNERFQKVMGDAVPYSTVIVEGSPVHEVVDMVRREGADLVVVGDKMNRKGIVAHKIARRISVPAVFVPDVKCPFRSLLLPVDMSPYSRQTVEWAIEFARRWEAEITLLHVYGLPPIAGTALALQLGLDEATLRRTARERAEVLFNERLRPLLDQSGIPYTFEAVFDEGQSLSHVITEYANRHSFHQVIVGAHGENALEAVLFGSVPEGLVKENLAMPLWIHRHPTH